MEKDYSLLRPFDLDAAKRGEKVCWHEDGDFAIEIFFFDNYVIPVFQKSVEEEQCGIFNRDDFFYLRMAPLAWVEGKPVYKGDVLWHNSGCFVTAKSSRTDNIIGFVAEDGDEVHPDNMTWQKPKTKREAWVNVYPNGYASHHKTKEDADRVATLSRITCCRIEWEE